MLAPLSDSYHFGDFLLDANKRLLLRNNEPASLTPKAFETLLYLVAHRDKIVDKNELMQAIWPDTIVEENNLNQNISTLRRVLGEARGENRYIVTVPGKGYRFIAAVESGQPALQQFPQKITLAVLPFENLSGHPEREYLADGLTEETSASLGQIDPEHLSVIGRTSVMAYKRAHKTLAEIGRELDATYLIESSLRAEGERLRITCKLIRASDQVQIWSASYDSEPYNLLNFQRELSGAIAEQIRLRLSPERLSALLRRQTRNAQAYDMYLRGRHLWNQLTPPTTKRAIEFYARATSLDPDYALAWSGLADAYSGGPISGDAPPLAVTPRACEAAARAVASDPGLAEAQASLGFENFWLEWNWPVAEAAFRKAIALDPNYSFAYRLLGILLSHLGHSEEASQMMRRARALDPLVAVEHALSAQVAFAARDYAAAIQFARQAIVVDPEFWIGHFQLGQAFVELGETAQALDALNNAGRFCGGNSKVVSLRGYLIAKLNKTAEALEVLNTLGAIARDRYVPPYAMALVHLGLDQRDQALDFLRRAYAVHDVHLAFLTVDPKWDPYRTDARFIELLKSCAFAPAALPVR
jgi:DNA-binding winged helix-turn-helix (wHTH) protein/Flp pilus assembly protein TadD